MRGFISDAEIQYAGAQVRAAERDEHFYATPPLLLELPASTSEHCAESLISFVALYVGVSKAPRVL